MKIPIVGPKIKAVVKVYSATCARTSFEKKSKTYLKTQLSLNMVYSGSFLALSLSKINNFFSNRTYMEVLGNISHLMMIWDAADGFAICFYNE